jgi:hypothetical protein
MAVAAVQQAQEPQSDSGQRVRKMLIALLIGLILLMAALGTATVFSLRSMKAAFNESTDSIAKKVALLGDLSARRADMKMTIRGMIMYTYRGNPAQIDVDRKNYNRAADQFESDLKELKPLVASQEGDEALARLQTDLGLYKGHFTEIDVLCRLGQANEATDYALGKIRGVTDDMLHTIEGLNRMQSDLLEKDKQQVATAYRRTILTSCVVLLLALLVGFCIHDALVGLM